MSHLDCMVGISPPFLRVLERIPLLAASSATILISGETGTGKELAARAIHYHSRRQGKPFIPVNCGALPDHLLENELFGHAKGAYTDASAPAEGLIAEAEGGTLFLDEIDALSPSAQVKFLRFLQDRSYRPLGSAKSRSADVRVVVATNEDLRALVRDKRFREDLYYRLNVLVLHIPPLRERMEDVPLLAHHFLNRYSALDSRPVVCLSPGALHKLMEYSWPGNVRELEGVIQRAVVLSANGTLPPDDIDLPVLNPVRAPGEDSFRAAKARAVERFERTYLIEILTRHEGNISRAAKMAGKDRRAFQRLLRKHGLERNAFRRPAGSTVPNVPLNALDLSFPKTV
jgi:two-component system response regulator GlrR